MTTDTILTPVQALTLPDTDAITRSANAAVRMANSFVITSPEDFTLAGEELQSVKGKINKLESQRTSITGPMNKALDAVNALFKGPMTALKNAEATIKGAMLTFSNEQDRLAAIARREAEEVAAKERQRLADEARRVEQEAAAERQRLADIETARVNAEAAERQRLENEAKEAAKNGDVATAAAIEQQTSILIENSEAAARQSREQAELIDQTATAQTASLRAEASVMSAPVVRVATPAAKGISKSVSWDYELIDMTKVIQHVAAHPEFANLLMLDSVRTRALVKSLGANCKIPGLNVFQKSTMSARKVA